MNVILDKSYLDGQSSQRVVELCSRHAVMMPDVLFYELMTTDKTSRSRCFSKIPAGENPLILIPNVGQYLRYEMTKKMPAVPITQLREKIRYNFNAGLADLSFELSGEITALLQQTEADINTDTKSFVERSLTTIDLFKALGYEAGDQNSIDSLIASIATDSSTVRRLYDLIISNKDTYFPDRIPPEQLGRKWATYRWMQVHVIYGLRFLKQYGLRIPSNAGTRFWRRAEHEMLDASYVILGSLAGSLATGDATMADTFRLLCPKGHLFRAPNLERPV